MQHLFLFVDVVTERLKVKRETEEAKQRTTEVKQEAETGSAKTAEGELTSQLDGGEHKDAEPKEDASSQGRTLYPVFSLLSLLSSVV